jgi:hypothetical protein
MSLPIRLYYDNDCEYLPLPDWASFLLDLGWDIARIDSSGKRLVLVLVLPTRAYAAALLATGIVLSRCAKSSAESTTAKEHFRQLCNLPPGTPILLHEENRKKRGTIKGYVDVDKLYEGSGPLICVELPAEKGGLQLRYVPLDRSQKIEVAENRPNKLTVRATAGEKILQNVPFIEPFGQHMNIWEFGLRSELESLVLGDVGLLRTEVTKQVFAVQVGYSTTKTRKSLSKNKIRKIRRYHKQTFPDEVLSPEFVTGILQDFLRVQRFSGNKPYRSNILPVRGTKPPVSAAASPPYFTIFDGARCFVNWRDRWLNTNWVVLLDRTESDFMEAVERINVDTLNRDGEELPFGQLQLPKGISSIIYQVVR